MQFFEHLGIRKIENYVWILSSISSEANLRERYMFLSGKEGWRDDC